MRLIAAGQLMAVSLIMTVTPSITVFTTALVAGRGGAGGASETYGISKRGGHGGLGEARSRGLAGRSDLGLGQPSSSSSSSIPPPSLTRDYEKKDTNLLERDDDNSGCAALGLSADYTACGQGLPGNFCCNTKAGFTCQAFNHNQSAICCPPGVDCAVFSQIPCNPQGLNVSSSQGGSATLHSTQILGGLIICSDLCCPQGYACAADGSKTCVLSSSNSTSVTASTPSTTGPIATLSNAPSASGLGPGQMTTPGGSSDSSHCAAYPSTAVLVGFFPGMAAGILGAVAALMCCSASNRKRNQQQQQQQQQHLQLDRGQQKGGASSSTRSSSRGSTDRVRAGTRPPLHHGPVSEPIFHDTGATRVDFLRRKSGRAARSSPKSPLSHGSAAVRSLFSGSTAGTHSPSSPRTPRAGANAGGSSSGSSGRESSTEVITVFSPPDAAFADHPAAGARGSASSTAAGAVGVVGAARDTRFDDMLGAARGQGLGFKNIAAPPAFMGSPSLVDGRRRALDGSTNIRG